MRWGFQWCKFVKVVHDTFGQCIGAPNLPIFALSNSPRYSKEAKSLMQFQIVSNKTMIPFDPTRALSIICIFLDICQYYEWVYRGHFVAIMHFALNKILVGNMENEMPKNHQIWSHWVYDTAVHVGKTLKLLKLLKISSCPKPSELPLTRRNS